LPRVSAGRDVLKGAGQVNGRSRSLGHWNTASLVEVTVLLAYRPRVIGPGPAVGPDQPMD
jgi:hypothetical protein